MIKFSLSCGKQHAFEAWFASNAEFDRLKAGGLLDCPVCGDNAIEKRLMAPAVRKAQGDRNPETSEVRVEPAGDERRLPAMAGAGLPPQIENQFRDQVRKLREAIQQNAENVGKRFPEEARKIHYGEAEKRGIFGEASPQEAKELIDEGVEILPIPVLPEDKN